MEIAALLKDKTVKTKEKTELLSSWLLNAQLSLAELMDYATTAKDPDKATCIEAMEFASRQQANIIDRTGFDFVTQTLTGKAPRVKWESAKVIGNTAHLFSDDLDEAISKLLDNTEYDGTVVRWSAAFALGEILKLKTKYNTDLLPALEAISETETQNSIKKIYQQAIKKSKLA